MSVEKYEEIIMQMTKLVVEQEHKIESLEQEKKAMRGILDGLLIEGPDNQNNIWISLKHKSMIDGCTFSFKINSLIGGVVKNFGYMLNNVKKSLTA